jgi:hypothetical protein
MRHGQQTQQPAHAPGRTRRIAALGAGAAVLGVLAVPTSSSAAVTPAASRASLVTAFPKYQPPALYVSGIGKIRAHATEDSALVDSKDRLHILSTATDGAAKPSNYSYYIRDLKTGHTTTTKLNFPHDVQSYAPSGLGVLAGGHKLLTFIQTCGAIFTSSTPISAAKLSRPVATGIDGTFCGDDEDHQLMGTTDLSDGKVAILVQNFTLNITTGVIQLYVGTPGHKFTLLSDQVPGGDGTTGHFSAVLGASLSTLRVFLDSDVHGTGQYLSRRSADGTWSTPVRVVRTSNPTTSDYEEQLDSVVDNQGKLSVVLARLNVKTKTGDDSGLYSATASTNSATNGLHRVPGSGSNALDPVQVVGPKHRTYLLFSRPSVSGSRGGLIEETATAHGWKDHGFVVRDNGIDQGDLLARHDGKAPLIVYTSDLPASG